MSGRVARGWLGVGLHPVALPSEIAEREGAAGGLMVVNLAEGGPAAGGAAAGRHPAGNGGVAVATPRGSRRGAWAGRRSGGRLALKVLRGGGVTTPRRHRRRGPA